MKWALKRILGAIETAFTSIRNRLTSHFKEHWRTTDDIENDRIENLAKRLQGESDRETLTNISEWQQRNIQFWSERWPLPNLLLYILAVEVAVEAVLYPISLILLEQELSFVEIYVPVILTIIATIAMFFLIIGVLLKWVRRIPVLKGLWNVFMPSISTNTLLENKLGVCRDYAKLTACLLQKIYRGTGTYQAFFVYAPQHQATAIMIGNRLPPYVLDRQLPIVTLDKWHERWQEGIWSNLWFTRKMEKIVGDCVEPDDIGPYLSKTEYTEPDTEKLRNEMITLLKIEEQTDDKARSFEIPWKKALNSMKMMKSLITLLQDF